MTRRRFFVPGELIRGDQAVLPIDQAHHLRSVLRIPAGEEVEIFDGSGNGYTGIVAAPGEEIRVVNLRRLDVVDQPRITLVLAAALIKPDRFEWVLQKGTELGVDEFIPLRTKHASARIPDERLGSRVERWRRIVREACKQCGRHTTPAVAEPRSFADFLATAGRQAGIRLLLSANATRHLVLEPGAFDRVVLCVGPEGGWDPEEEEEAADRGFGRFGLGGLVLRAETASLAAVAIVQHELAALNKRADSDTKGHSGSTGGSP